jgi:hypothetical protein
MNLQDSKASDAKTLQSQNSQNTKIRILLSALRVIHGRQPTQGPARRALQAASGNARWDTCLPASVRIGLSGFGLADSHSGRPD